MPLNVKFKYGDKLERKIIQIERGIAEMAFFS